MVLGPLRGTSGVQTAVMFLLASIVTSAAAAAVVSPRSLAETEGNGGEGTTGFLGVSPETVLYQIAASELTVQGLAVGDSIIGVRARLNSGLQTGPATPTSWPDFTIKLALATNSIGTMSTTFASNMMNPVTVLTGPYTLPANSMPGGSTPNAFGTLIQFTTPYTYQGGDLAFYFSHNPASGPAIPQDGSNSYTGVGTLYRGLITSVPNATTGSFTPALVVLQFETVPEPAAASLICAGAAPLSLGRRRGMRSA